MAHLQLRVTDYEDETSWRWVLSDAAGAFLADHEVELDRGETKARAFFDLPGFLESYRAIKSPGELLAEAGAWIGEHVFGAVADALAKHREEPATVVRVAVPEEAQGLLRRPFELAHLPIDGSGVPLAAAGVRFVYQRDEAPEPGAPKPAAGSPGAEKLRVLAVFSLPHSENPLNLRRERVELERFLRQLSQTRGAAIELRVLQYGATRDTLKEALKEGAGWDLVHLSGHGLEGQLALEDEHGETDVIVAGELAGLLKPARKTLKLLTLSSCLSGAGSLKLARRQIGLDEPHRDTETRPAEAGPPVAAEGDGTQVEIKELPSLAQSLARSLDCAVLGMRYQVGDDFARDSVLALYGLLLEKGQPLPEALQLALSDTTGPEKPPAPALSLVTPILFGPRAADLRLVPPPPHAAPTFELRPTSLAHFPPPPLRFVGRLRPMLRASQVFAPESPRRGVLLYGMAGGGKTACALELAYRHEKNRFQAMAWWKAPDEDQDITGALLSFAQALETQLPGLELVGLIDDPKDFGARVVPMLKDLVQRYAILIVLDNLESLLTSKGRWRDDRWRALVAALLEQRGTSRLVLTSRRLPADLEDHPQLLREPIHALSLPESVLLARELPGLSTLFDTAEDRRLVRRVLAAAQGHPKLLELADGLAGSDRQALEAQLGAEDGDGERAFFAEGESARGPAAFVAVLEDWTAAITSHLPNTALLLFQVLCRMEYEDLQSPILEATWKHILERLREESTAAAAALAEPTHGLAGALELLVTCGLLGVERLPVPEGAPPAQRFRVHPAVAEAGRGETPAMVRRATDLELGNFWGAMFDQAYEKEMSGAGGMVVEAGRRATPYLLRAERWKQAGALLEQVTLRDASPATLAFALPRLREIVAATEGTPEGLANEGILGKALVQAGKFSESESLLRELIERCEVEGESYQASTNCGHLVNLLSATGRLSEALETVRRKVNLTRRAGLGPWTQILDERMALEVLVAMGRNEEVLERVEGLRNQIAKLPKERSGNEAVEPWNVHEETLDTGHAAALRLERWETALDLNAEIVRLSVERGAGPVELAQRRFNDYGPLLRLRRFDATREILEACRHAFEQAKDVAGLGRALQALADLEDSQQNLQEAVRFGEIGLRYNYQAGDPEDCAISHNNIANYLRRSGAEAERVLAHRLAAAVTFLQTGSGYLPTVLRSLVATGLPNTPPVFAGVADLVEELSGVKFRQLFARLPRRAADGDAALAEVWKLAEEERDRREAVMQGLPPKIAAAFESGQPEQVQAVLEALTPEEQQAVLEQLGELAREAGMPAPTGPDMAQVLRNFAPLLHGIAAVARGDDSGRDEIEEVLPRLEEEGWKLIDAVHRIWNGERDARELTSGLDPSDTRLVERILELIELPSLEEMRANLPAAVRKTLEAGDEEALRAALDDLPAEEARAVVAQLAIGIEASAEPDMAQILEDFTPLLHGIAAVARGDDSRRDEIEEVLPRLEEDGWKLTGAVHRIWAGERDAEALSSGLDPSDTMLVERILELIELPSPEEVLAGLPEAVRKALEAQDVEALRAALGDLPPEEAKALVEQLEAVGILGSSE